LARLTARKLGIGAAMAAALFLLIQVVPVSRTNPPVTIDLPAPAPVKEILQRSCYDCHSNETRWPWYSRIAPVSWWMVEHVNEGRGDLNFSQWPVFDLESRQLFLRDIIEQLEEKNMPLRSYVWGHPGARLSDQDRALLLDWARAEIQ